MPPRRKPEKKDAPQIPAEMKRALAGRRAGADSEQLLADLIDIWGGTRKLAQDLYAEFQAAGKGGMTRQRILEMIQRLIITNTTHDIGRAITPADMTDEELERVACSYLKRMTDAAPSAAGPAGEGER